MKIDRRRFIELAGLTGLVLLAPTAFAGPRERSKVVVFIELSGGNDGLNTVVPFKDPLYRKLRPNLALNPRELRTLDAETALHPSLENLAKSWDAGELAVVEGLGYPEPNRSHFRSIEIWEQGTGADDYADAGWVARAVPKGEIEKFAPAALTVGGGGEGPLAGSGTLELEDPDRLFKMTRRIQRSKVNTSNPALAHVLNAQNDLLDATETVRKHADKAPSFGQTFKGNRLLRPLELGAQLIASGMPMLALKVRVGGFDTHVNQARPHARLLKVVDEGLGAFREAMKTAGIWDDVLIVTYSEFGRRARENGGAGTDHGTAAPHFVMGGAVKGGRYGKRPALDTLDANGDLRFTTDFRQMYNTIATKWWGFDGGDFSSFNRLAFV